MKNKELLWYKDQIIRILDIKNNKAFVIDCVKRTMPIWVSSESLQQYYPCAEEVLSNNVPTDIDNLDPKSKKIAYARFTLIAPLLPFVSDFKKRNEIIAKVAAMNSVSKQTVRYYLCLYLVYQNITALAPKQSINKIVLTQDEKNMRWGLNKFFYTQCKNSLSTAYTLMLKEKYCDSQGNLLPEHPSFYQFRYFYRKTRKMQTYYISRNGLKHYQRNNRPLLGDGIQEYASSVGMGMLDATVCDIYLVNEAGNLIGRPILTACVDAYSSLCCGYSLSWEGGMYSVKNLMLNIITNKQTWCKQRGINIKKEQWDVNQLPAIFVTDMGSEYKSTNFEQITELGIRIVNLPSYRPELKGMVEKFFDLLQSMYKPHLKGKGVIEPDFQERGAHDYRKDACLTMDQFEKIILQCIIYYNSKRVVANFPYTEQMLDNKIQPFACDIWKWSKTQPGTNLIDVSEEQLMLTLLPRTTGKFSRYGLIVNKLRYKNENFTEEYLTKKEVRVAYNPDDVSTVWTVKEGFYTPFELIEARYRGKKLSDVKTIDEDKKELIKAATASNWQAQVDLAKAIEGIALLSSHATKPKIKDIKISRSKERMKTHVNFMEMEGEQ